MQTQSLVAATSATLILLFTHLPCAECLDNGLGRVPPMGFNTWTSFGCIPPVGSNGPSDALMRTQASALISSGLAEAGYVYVNIDDCWQLTERSLPWENPNARQIANPKNFPHGMKALADHLHSLGLKLGVYSARCRYTCQLFAASFGHERIDAQQWAEWGYVQIVYCDSSMIKNMVVLGNPTMYVQSNSDLRLTFSLSSPPGWTISN